MNFLEMLIVSRKMLFVDGSIILYGQKILILPSPSMIKYIDQISNNPEDVKIVYHTAKDSIIEYGSELLKEATTKDVNWMINTFNLYGIGNIKYEKTANPPIGEITLSNSPFINNNKAIENTTVDHFPRGIIAGIASVLFGADFEVIETKCNDNGTCKLFIDSSDNITKNFPAYYEKQI